MSTLYSIILQSQTNHSYNEDEAWKNCKNCKTHVTRLNESDVHSCIIAFINGSIDFEIVFQVSLLKENR